MSCQILLKMRVKNAELRKSQSGALSKLAPLSTLPKDPLTQASKSETKLDEDLGGAPCRM
jgi:hypothetical protein